jgi:hypothetical protein
MTRRPWTPTELTLLHEHYADSRTADIAAALDRTVGQVYQAAERYGLRKSDAYLRSADAYRLRRGSNVGARHRFKPGHVPANKGVKHPPGWAPGNMAAHQFKPGAKPHTWVPVGSLRINSDGYLDRKVNDKPGPSSVRWKPLHRLTWEAAHGPVHAGRVVVFKPGRNTTDPKLVTLDAVECITRRELMQRNTMHNLPKPLAQLVQLRGVLNRAINQRLKTDGAPAHD